MRKSLLITLGIIFLSFTSITLFAQQNRQFKRDMMKERMPEMMRDRMADKLNLTDEQKTAIEELRLQHQKAMVPIKAEMEQKEIEMKELRLKGNYTREQFISKVKEISEIKNRMEISRAENQMDIYELLNDEQKATWNKMRGNFGDHRREMMHERMDKHMGPPKDFE
jgi:Spy/CpxP family protein refolding chaperone